MMREFFGPGAWLAALCAAVPVTRDGTELDALREYVAKDDASYRSTRRREGQVDGVSYVELILTSQTWRGVPWKHQLFIFKPAQVRHASNVLLVISGGRWEDSYEQPVGAGDARFSGAAGMFSMIAERVGSPVAVLLQVPHQPIFDGMVEDRAIAYTFDQALTTGDATWPLLLPMVKSAVRAMDAVQDHCQQSWSLDIEHFTVTGASKRGWTTWLTAAVDRRVTALAPMVIDMLNLSAQMRHQVDAWGDYSEELHDYTECDLPARLQTQEGQALERTVDPYAYRKAIDQPKVILLGTNDSYWPLDALNLYWGGLVGEKHITYVPNAGHGLGGDLIRVLGSVIALHHQACGALRLPQMLWHFTEANARLRLVVRSDRTPASLVAWVAESNSRDFRDAVWESVTLEPAAGVYEHRLRPPRGKFAALFAEATYDDLGTPYTLSTNVRIAGPGPVDR